MRKYILLTLLASLFGFQLLNALPARPGKYTVTQPDGSRLVVQRHGDEWGHWLTDESGRMVRQEEDGFYRIVSDGEAASIRQQASLRRNLRRRFQTEQAARRGKNAVLGQRHFLVILVEFNDLSFKAENDRQAFDDKMNLPGYSRIGGTGSARDFYFENSGERFEPIFDVYGPVKLSEDYAYYGKNDNWGYDEHPEEAVADGCRALDEEVDFSIYDNDGDGKVDLVFMYYAGYGEADGGSANTIWPHQYELSYAGISLTLDDVIIDSYACSNELVGYGELKGKMDGIGAACHEFGHAMGLPDFYDTDDYQGGYAGGLYSYSTMDGGCYNNEGRTPPYFNFEERMLLGWVDESDYLEFGETGTYTMGPINDNVAYRTSTDMDGEYFVYENRTRTGWDKYLPGEGMVVYHVDKSSRRIGGSTAQELWANWQMSNSINASGSHPCFYVVPAANQSSLNYSYEGRMPFPYGTVDYYVPLNWNGLEGEITFSEIDHANGTVSLRARVPSGELDYNVIADPGGYSAGDRFYFELEEAEDRHPDSVEWFFDDEPVQADSVTLTAGAHVIEALLTYSGGVSERLMLEIEVE